MLNENQPTSFPITRHVVGRTPSYSDAPLNKDGLHPLQIKYANWTEDFVDPDEPHQFPLRELAPGVVEFLSEASHLSQRDIRYLSERLKLADRVQDFDPKDPIAFYDALLDVTEANPWVMPMLELEVVGNRSGVAHGKTGVLKNYRKHLDRTLGKLMLSKLRFKGNNAIQERLHELVSCDPPPTDLWVGAFCEYALDHYLRMTERAPEDLFGTVYEMCLGNLKAFDLLETAIEEAEESGEWSFPLRLIRIECESSTERAVPLSDEEFAMLRKILSALTSRLSEESTSEDYRAISYLAALAAEMVELRDRVDIDFVISALSKTGIEIPNEALDEDTAAMFCDERILRLIDELILKVKTLGEGDARSAELDEQIAEATKARRYDQIRELADEAENLTAQIDHVENMHTQMESIRDAILAKDAEMLENLLAELPGLEKPEAERGEPDAPEAGDDQDQDFSEDSDEDSEAFPESVPMEAAQIEDEARGSSVSATPSLVTNSPEDEAAESDMDQESAQTNPQDGAMDDEDRGSANPPSGAPTGTAATPPVEAEPEDEMDVAELEAATAPGSELDEEPYVEPPLPTRENGGAKVGHGSGGMILLRAAE